MEKTLGNTDMELKNEASVEIAGNPGKWVCVCKAWCKKEGWMKSTKVMQLAHGCLVQVSTQQHDKVAEALAFVAGAKLEEFK